MKETIKMNFSKCSTYGLRALAYLAKYWDEESLSLSDISEQEQISKKYLEQIFIKLKEAKLVKSKKGKQGGYQLSKKPEDISVFEIVEALEGGVAPSSCLTGRGESTCEKSFRCGVVLLLTEIQAEVINILKNKSLRDIERMHK